MSSLILLPHIRVENANAVAGLTWGFPAITHFLGYVHTLSRTLSITQGLTLSGCAVISHEHQVHAYSSGRDYQFALTRNPLTREGKTASFNEEGRMHMTISLLIECQGEILNGEYGKAALAAELKTLCQSHKLAGGNIITLREPQVFNAPENEKELRKILWRMMPGYALCDRHEWLTEHHQALQQQDPQSTLLDAWLDFSAVKYQATRAESDEKTVSWDYQTKPNAGYLVPMMCGYQRVSPLYPAGEVANTRDPSLPFAFAEAVYGIGEWRGLHRIPDIASLIWRYHTTDTGYYCAAGAVSGDVPFNDDDDLE
jgi:CRISPR-associated protein Csy2